MKKLILRINNRLASRKKHRFPPESILLLCPRCLQNSECRQRISSDPQECLRCGRCDITGLLELVEKYGVVISFATGGGEAVAAVRSHRINAVVAVACGKELLLGLVHTGRKPVIALELDRPEGPCRNTRIDLEAVEVAIRSFLGVDR